MEGDSISIILAIIFIILFSVETVLVLIFYLKNKKKTSTDEEIISMVNEGHENGEILASEAEMIQNVLEFDDKDVKDVMVHRKNIVAIDSGSTLRQAIDQMNDNHFSRYPVYSDNIDNIIGLIHIKDALKFYNDPKALDCEIGLIEGLLSEPQFVPETHGINTLFAKMQSKKNHMILVVDEYGQLSGMLSMEDILEELVGSILDEHDVEENVIEKVDERHYLMDGSTSLEDVEDEIGILLSDELKTLNGYIINLLGKIPEDNSSFTVEDDNFIFNIKDVKEKVVKDVVVTRKI